MKVRLVDPDVALLNCFTVSCCVLFIIAFALVYDTGRRQDAARIERYKAACIAQPGGVWDANNQLCRIYDRRYN